MNRIIHNETDKAIKSGIGCLAKNQREDGSFPGFVTDSKSFDRAKKNQSVFPTCLILSSLDSLPESKELERIKSKAAKFLLGQKSDFWSWNYWKRNSSDSKATPYPDDLDDTCCAMAALIKNSPKAIPVKAIANVVNLLAYCESKEGGPYYTWITPPDADKGWKDIDLAVNSNIAFFLSLQEVTLPSLVSLAEKAIISGKYDSPYYHSPYAVIYFISRWYKGRKKNKIISYLLKKKLKNHSWGNPLETALAVSALINLDCKKEIVEESIASILKNRVNGKWVAYPFVVEKIKGKQKYYSGSAELTTAFCLEAISKFSDEAKSIVNGKEKAADKEAERIYTETISITERRFFRFDSETVETFSDIKEKISKGSGASRITLLPYYFYKSLRAAKSIDEKVIVDLCAAGFYGLAAYTIYDDFLDGEGDPKFLSAANVCLRELTSIYDDIFSKDKKFQELFRNTMDRIDAANAWETSKCRTRVSGSRLMIPERLPDYGNMERLADRSIGYALGPAAVLYIHTEKIEFPEMKNLMAFFENYIIARQLNDDAHDWEADLKNGQLSPAVVSVLKKYSGRHKNKKESDLKKETKELQKIFWHEVIQEVCGKSIFHVKKAGRHLRKIASVKDKTAFEAMLASVEKSAEEALTEQKEMLEFLEEYR
ncbi:MAG TPA: terpene cyclase/mutase family protein [Candidatus Moranbacteria bacterium]|nr:terpene cyclase/mutase family protein [Candidatus Moranbacteria bacterium]